MSEKSPAAKDPSGWGASKWERLTLELLDAIHAKNQRSISLCSKDVLDLLKLEVCSSQRLLFDQLLKIAQTNTLCQDPPYSADYLALFVIRTGSLACLKRMHSLNMVKMHDNASIDNKTFLMQACSNAAPSLEIVKYLVSTGASVNANFYQATPLHYALGAPNHNLQVVEYLAPLTCKSLLYPDKSAGKSLVMYACGASSHSLPVVKFAVSINPQSAFVVHQEDKYGRTALMHACSAPKHSLEVVQYLVDLGSDVQASDHYGMTALMHACRASRHSAAVIQFLVEAGSPLDTRDISNDMDLLMHASRAPSHSSVAIQYLIARGLNVSGVDHEGLSPLMYACKSPYPCSDVIRQLVSSGADPAAEDVYGRSALAFVLESNCPTPGVIEYLQSFEVNK